MKIEKGSFELMKQLNQQIVLRQIRDYAPTSRADIAKRTKLTPPTVSKVVSELLSAGIILETEIGESHGGRRPILLTINPKGGYIVGLSIEAQHIQLLVTDLEMKKMAQQLVELRTREPEAVCSLITDLVEQVIQETQISRERILGVGVAIGGVVDHLAGISVSAPHLEWQGVPIRDKIQERLKLPVTLDNDVRLMAVGERWRGSAAGIPSFAYVHVDQGVGTGIYLNGQPLRGANHAAGAIGHLQVDWAGPECSCGKTGCLNALVSMEALEGQSSDRIRQVVATYLGRGIASVIHLLDLHQVILAGRVMDLAPGIVEAIQDELTHHLKPRSKYQLMVTKSTLGANAHLIGAVSMILEDFYKGGSF